MKSIVISVAETLVQGRGRDCVVNHLNTATTSNTCLWCHSVCEIKSCSAVVFIGFQ